MHPFKVDDIFHNLVIFPLYQICNNKDENEVWFVGLKALVSRGRHQKWRTESRRDGVLSETDDSTKYAQRSLPFVFIHCLQKLVSLKFCSLRMEVPLGFIAHMKFLLGMV